MCFPVQLCLLLLLSRQQTFVNLLFDTPLALMKSEKKNKVDLFRQEIIVHDCTLNNNKKFPVLQIRIWIRSGPDLFATSG
jgi:hypothetical protein